MSDRPLREGIIGRHAERATLSALLDRARDGSGGFAWIEGSPGIGKSHLLAVLVDQARRRGDRVLTAGAQELATHRPFGVIADCLGITRRTTDGPAAPAARALLGAPDRSELLIDELLLDAVEQLCGQGPVLLALDDLQWADPSSLGFLARLAQEVGGQPLAVLATARRRRGAELDQLIAATTTAGALRIFLGPLSVQESGQLATELAAGLAPDELGQVVRRCGGNPLFVSMLVRGAQAEGEVGGRGEPPPVSLRLAVIAWLSFLGSETVDVLGLASVLGSRFSLADLALLSHRDTAPLWSTLRDAVVSGVLREAGDGFEFTHDVVREALYEDLPEPVRAGLHAEFAHALGDTGAPATRVAEHLLRGARPGDRQAVEWLRTAAREVAPRGPKVAVDLLEAALRLTGDGERAAIEAELAPSLMASGRLADAERICREALAADPDPGASGALRLCLIDALMRQGRVAEVIALAGETAELRGLGDADRARAQSWLVIGPLLARDVPATMGVADRAAASAKAAGHDGALVHALVAKGHAASFDGDFLGSQRWLGEAVQVAQRADTTDAHVAGPLLDHALALLDCDLVDEARSAIDTGRRTYERLGMTPASAMVPQYAGYVAFVAGDWDDALAEFETATAVAARAGTGWQVDALTVRALLHARRGELDAAERQLAKAREHIAAGGFAFKLGWLGWTSALLLEERGDTGAALTELWTQWTTVTSAPMRGEQRALAPDLVRLLLLAGDRDGLAEVAAAIDELRVRNPGIASLHALAEQCAAAASGDADRAARAALAYRETPLVHQAALADEAAALALAGAGRPADAGRHAVTALASYARLGAVRDADRLRGTLRTAGVRLPGRRPRTRATSGWASLTVSEQRVARLVGEGLSNREIAARLVVSYYTVATHVSHVLRKLGLRTRVELAANLNRLAEGG